MPEESTQAQAAENQQAVTEQSAGDRIDAITSEAELEAAFDELNSREASDAAEKQPEATSQPQEQEAESTQQDDTEEETQQVPERVRLNSLETKDRAIVLNAVQMVRDGLAGNITEAIAKITGQSAAAQTSDDPDDIDPAAAAENDFNDKIAAQEQEVESIRTALRKAKDDFDTEAEMQLLESLQDAKSEIRFLKYAKEQELLRSEQFEEQRAAAAFETEYQSFREQANSIYPDGSKPGTPMFEEVRKTVAWFEQNNPAIFSSPNYPLAIAGIASSNLAKANGANGSNAPRPTATQFQPQANRAPSRPTNMMVGDDATTTATAQQNVLSAIDKITSEEDLEALAEAVFAGR